MSTKKSEQKDSIGLRLGQERKRLGYSQTVLGAKLDTSKATQIKYEANYTRPDADYLFEVNQLGADIYYIITGEQLEALKNVDERQLLASYRLLDNPHKPIVLHFIKELAQTNVDAQKSIKKTVGRTKK